MTGPRTRRTLIVTLAVAVVWVALVAGSVVTLHGDHSEGTITYELTWDTEAATFGSDEWTVQTVTGVVVTVDSGFLTTRTMQLGACTHDHDGWLGRIIGLFGTLRQPRTTTRVRSTLRYSRQITPRTSQRSWRQRLER